MRQKYIACINKFKNNKINRFLIMNFFEKNYHKSNQIVNCSKTKIPMDFTNINNWLIVLLVFLTVFIYYYYYYFYRHSRTIRRQKQIVELIESKQINHNTILLTFMLSDFKKKLGLRVGQHIQLKQKIQGEIVRRKYTPISPLDRIGSFQIIVKVYEPNENFPEGGKMSSFLSTLKLHEKIKISLPFGRFVYEGCSRVQITDSNGLVHRNRFKYFYMIAEGTGITSIFQIIRYICENQKGQSSPNLTLLYFNKTDMNVLLEKEIQEFQRKNTKMKVHYFVGKNITNDEKYEIGTIDEAVILKTVSSKIFKTLFLSAGSSQVYTLVDHVLRNKLKVPEAQIYRF